MKLSCAIVSVIMGLSLGVGIPKAADAKTLRIACGSGGIEGKLCRQGIEEWSKKSSVDVKIVSTPNSSTERLALYLQILGAGSQDIDVFQVDVVWPGTLAKHFVDLKPYFSEAHRKRFFPRVIENNSVEERLVAIPWFVSAGLLYYRKDLLEKYAQNVPRTWEELEKVAGTIMAKENKNQKTKLWGYIFQGRPYEGLTCNALEWIAGAGGGTIVDQNKKITVKNKSATKILAQAASWVGSIAPKGVLSYEEEEARGVFQSGRSIFLRSWPYVWPLANSESSPVKGKVGIAPVPSTKGEPSRAALGGWGLSVSKYSQHPSEAVSLVKYLTSRKVQRHRFEVGGFNPSIVDLYDDPELQKKMPYLSELKQIFLGTVPRPSTVLGNQYPRVSYEFWTAVHAVLSKDKTADEALTQLERRLKKILK